jgi:hypothetical protein
MPEEYEIFEKFLDGSSIWRACVRGRFAAKRKIHELSERSENRFYAIDLQTNILLPAEVLRANFKGQRKEHQKIA